MSQSNLDYLHAQIHALVHMLAELPSDDVLERGGLQARLKELRVEVAHASPQPLRAIVDLTFRGNPVSGISGIKADFASKAVEAFERAVVTIAASITLGDLKGSGPVPARGSHQLLITDCVRGSFGFRLEEVLDENALSSAEESPVLESLRQTMAILEACALSDEKLVDALGEASPRVLTPIKDFLAVMYKAEATCGMDVNGSRFRFEDANEVAMALERAKRGVEETTESFRGVLRGLLPGIRKYEFRTDEHQVLTGKVDRTMGELEGFRYSNDERFTAKFLVRVAGTIKKVKSYTLIGLSSYISP